MTASTEIGDVMRRRTKTGIVLPIASCDDVAAGAITLTHTHGARRFAMGINPYSQALSQPTHWPHSRFSGQFKRMVSHGATARLSLTFPMGMLRTKRYDHIYV